ncbi:MAG: PaaI family thioesterase [Actinobacteria bacterium]|nr:MAG: PaaI family thioesterase [Actinomycetota bacterium]
MAIPLRHPDAPAPGVHLPSHYVNCFACGPEHVGGLHIELQAAEGLAVTGRFIVGEAHQGAPGIAHGGILAAVMDELLGSLNWMLMSPAVTIELTTRFRRPAPVDAELWLSAHVLTVVDGTVQSAGEARLDTPDGELAVVAKGLFRQVPADHFRRHGRPSDVANARGDAPWRARQAAGDPGLQVRASEPLQGFAP